MMRLLIVTSDDRVYLCLPTAMMTYIIYRIFNVSFTTRH